MAQYLYETRISDHLALTPEKYLVATACVLTRSGEAQYRMSELVETSNSDELVTVNRPVSEVTSPKFLASLPGKSFVVTHNAGMVNADTHAWSARGTVLRAYVGSDLDEDGNVLVLGDIVVTDPQAIRRILDGERQLSLGYKYDLAEGPNGLEMKNLIANHCALVEAGRMSNAQIVDSALSWGGGENAEEFLPGGTGDTPIPAGARAAVSIDDDEEGQSHQEQINELIKDEDEDIMKKTQDQNEDQNTRIDRLCTLLEQLLSRKAADETLVPVATLPESGRGSNPVIDDLRRLKPYVQASRNRAAIDAWNAAMVAAKRGVAAPAQQFIAAYDSGAVTSGPSFSEMVEKRGRELRDGKMPSERTDYSSIPRDRLAQDSQAKTESYQDMVARVGEKMQGAKFQRG
jgi:hypothetical protein